MNVIRSFLPDDATACSPRTVTDQYAIINECANLLCDESRLTGSPVRAVYFPSSTLEVSQAMRQCCNEKWSVVISGARTGIVGGAVPVNTDAIISLEQMTSIGLAGKSSVQAQCGISLENINQFIEARLPEYFYPVDPTETSASLGGSIAVNASGARTYFYGPTRNWIDAIKVVLADGSILNLRRGEVQADGRTFVIKLPGKNEIQFEFPKYSYPETKNTTGFILNEDMDAIDLFIGSEGILGIITEAEIRLLEKPLNRLYTVIWTIDEPQSLKVVSAIRSSQYLQPLAIEYFDPHSIRILRDRKKSEGQSSQIPNISILAGAAIFIDFAYDSETDFEIISGELSAILESHNLSPDDTWSGLEDKDLVRMKQLRHALPETINMIVSERKKLNPGIHKLGTDLAVPDGALNEMMAIYRATLEKQGIEYVIFGHIGNNHLHVNMLPKTDDELYRAKGIYESLAREAVRLGGTIAGEHGIGRLKRHLMTIQYPSEMLDSMRELKRIFDPHGILNPGVLLPD